MVRLYQGRIGYLRDHNALCQQGLGEGMPIPLDTSIKSGDPAFAPSWPLVLDYKANRISWEEYQRRYRLMMLKSYKYNRARWEAVLAMDAVAFLCYCRVAPWVNCHRELLVSYFVKLGGVDSGIAL